MKASEDLKKAVESLGGEFELIRELGRGATAVVYLLRDHALQRDLAMKVIRTRIGGDDEGLARLQREARLVAQLMHPNIVKLYGTHRLPDGSLALLMEHVPGRNLKEVLREEGPLSVPNAIRVLKDIASALAYAHRRRIVHRDVKPENIYIDEEVGAARLADFGVARSWDQDARLTLPGESLGTPAYMSPEQIDGKEVDGRTDVYSLGLVGYEMILGHHPWEGENVFTIIFRQKNEELPVDLLDLADAPVLARTLERALAKDPADRPESAMAFLEELSEERGGEDGAGSPVPSRIEIGEAPGAWVDQSSVGGEEVGPLTPVDWSTVEGESHPPDPDIPDQGTGDDSTSSRAVLGVRRKGKWGRVVALSAVVLTASSYSAYRWLPLGGRLPTGEAAAGAADFSPIPASPTPTAVEPPLQSEGVPASPAGLVIEPGAPTAGPVGSLIQVTAQARGEGGYPLVDAQVLFQVEDGDGVLSSPEARTNADGVVTAEVQLPEVAGVTLLIARVAGLDGLEARLELTAEPGSPQRVVPINGDGQTGTEGEALPEYLGIRVLDQFGNQIPDTEVRFEVLQGGGSVAPSRSRTDEVGRTFFRWTLGSSDEPQRVAAVIPGAEDGTFAFRATSEPIPEPEPQAPVEEETRPPPPDPVDVVIKTFAIGGGQVCHLSGRRVTCRGANDRGQGGSSSLGGLVGIAAGISHGCGLSADGQAWCWGANESGQLGDGSTADSRSGVAVDTDLRFSVLAAGLTHTCGLGPGGAAYCWGRNVGGQLGDGSRADHLRPAPAGGGQFFQEIVAGWNHTCGLAGGSRAFCWGSNSEGQLGDGFRVDRLIPTRVPGNFQALAGGANHTCGIRGVEVFCWGDNAFGQLGDGTTQDRISPVRVAELPGSPLVLASGAVHTCALLRDRSAYCWGQNLHGQLGDGTTENRSTPVRVSGDLEFVAIFAGGGMTCGFAPDGSEYCWGLNQSGQLGDGSRTNRSSPVRIGGSRP